MDTNAKTRIFGKLSKFSQKEIDLAFKQASCKIKKSVVTILAAPRQHEAYARLLLILPRAIGNAPQRNKLRRQLKSIFYQEKLYEGPCDLIILAKKGIIEYSFEQLRSLLVD